MSSPSASRNLALSKSSSQRSSAEQSRKQTANEDPIKSPKTPNGLRSFIMKRSEKQEGKRPSSKDESPNIPWLGKGKQKSTRPTISAPIQLRRDSDESVSSPEASRSSSSSPDARRSDQRERKPANLATSPERARLSKISEQTTSQQVTPLQIPPQQINNPTANPFSEERAESPPTTPLLPPSLLSEDFEVEMARHLQERRAQGLYENTEPGFWPHPAPAQSQDAPTRRRQPAKEPGVTERATLDERAEMEALAQDFNATDVSTRDERSYSEANTARILNAARRQQQQTRSGRAGERSGDSKSKER